MAEEYLRNEVAKKDITQGANRFDVLMNHYTVIIVLSTRRVKRHNRNEMCHCDNITEVTQTHNTQTSAQETIIKNQIRKDKQDTQEMW